MSYRSSERLFHMVLGGIYTTFGILAFGVIGFIAYQLIGG